MKPAALVLAIGAFAFSSAYAETFVIEAEEAGHEATIKIPAGAVTKLSADRAESLDGYAGAQIEAMRLSGDVSIGIAGSKQPIEIRADSVVVELTADSAPVRARHTRADTSVTKLVGTSSSYTGHDSWTFVGSVVCDLQTSSGPMEIKADRVEHQLTREPGA